MTPRELKAHADVYQLKVRRWAFQQAAFHNAYFRGQDDVGWTTEDFLGSGNREQRQIEHQKSMMVAATANANLMAMKRGDVPDNLPDWAKG